MDTHNKNKQYYSDTFTNTSSIVFRIITAIFLIYNFITVKFWTKTGPDESQILLIGVISAVLLCNICFIEPAAYKKNSRASFALNTLSAACLGFISYLWRTPVLTTTFFTNILVAGLRFPISKSIMLSVIYYLSYVLSAIFSSQGHTGMVLYDIHVLIVLIAISYICHYFSVIENEKNKQDEVIVELMEDRANLFKDLGSKNTELDRTYWEMIETLIEVIEVRDNFTGGHSVKVCEYSVKLARKMGFSENEISNIMKASILHDIGKMGIPDNILLKPDTLSSEEYHKIMNHPEIGCKLLARIKGLEDVIPMILYHHERVDGTGYPYGIAGDRIPIGAKVISIADAYDAMTSNRPYRKALIKKEAKKRLMEASGTQFDSQLVQKFMDVIDEDNVDDIRNFRQIDNIKKIPI